MGCGQTETETKFLSSAHSCKIKLSPALTQTLQAQVRHGRALRQKRQGPPIRMPDTAADTALRQKSQGQLDSTATGQDQT